MKLKNTKLRQGDEVIVVSGREKGKRGNIKKIVGDKCIVNDLNLAKKHTRPNLFNRKFKSSRFKRNEKEAWKEEA